MAAGRTASSRLVAFEIDWNPPVSEFYTLRTDQLLAVAGVGFMTDTAGASFAIDDDVHVVEVA